MSTLNYHTVLRETYKDVTVVSANMPVFRASACIVTRCGFYTHNDRLYWQYMFDGFAKTRKLAKVTASIWSGDIVTIKTIDYAGKRVLTRYPG